MVHTDLHARHLTCRFALVVVGACSCGGKSSSPGSAGSGGDSGSGAVDQIIQTAVDKIDLLFMIDNSLSTVRSPAPPEYGNTGFLAWHPAAKHAPPGEANPSALISNFQAQLTAAGETGCGFEASLEAWYRFLIDPDPAPPGAEEHGRHGRRRQRHRRLDLSEDHRFKQS